jgi:hypothetical protein
LVYEVQSSLGTCFVSLAGFGFWVGSVFVVESLSWRVSTIKRYANIMNPNETITRPTRPVLFSFMIFASMLIPNPAQSIIKRAVPAHEPLRLRALPVVGHPYLWWGILICKV